MLLYSPSGAGKSSLLDAGLRPILEEERFGPEREKLGILGLLRVGAPPDAPDGESQNRYLRSVLAGLPSPGSPGGAAEGTGLLDARLRALETSRNVLIFDQFEELLTAQAGDDDAKADFLREVGLALEDRSRSAIFAMREDYIAGLDPFLYLIPTRLGTRFRIDLLKPERALEAVKGPAKERDRPFEEGAAEELISDLRRVQVARNDGTLGYEDGPYVDPLHLQLVCRNLWTKTAGGDRIAAADVASDDVEGHSSVEFALRRYYASEVERISTLQGVDEREIRNWFDTQLIVGGYRGQTQANPVGRVPLDHPLTQKLLDSHLVRTNQRGGTTWFELAHDRLIDPVKRDNREWRKEHGNPLELAADAWDQQGRVSSALLIGDDLDRVRPSDQGALTDVERSFLLASEEADQKARAELEEQRLEKERLKEEAARRDRSLKVLTGVLAAFVALAGVAAVVALMFSEERGKANTAAAESRAARLSLESSDALHAGDLELGALLGVEAFNGVEHLGPAHVAAAKEALLRAQQASPSLRTFLRPRDATGTAIRSIAFSPDGSTLASGSLDGRVTLWDAAEGTQLGDPSQGRSGPVASLAFGPDGSTLATGSKGDSVMIWDARDPSRPVAALEGDAGTVAGIAVSPDGSTLVWGSNAQREGGTVTGTVSAWDIGDLTQPEMLLERETGPVVSIALSPDGSTLVSGSNDGLVSVWDLSDPTRPVNTLRHGTDPVTSIALSPDGRTLATGSGSAGPGLATTTPPQGDTEGPASTPDIKVQLWDLETSAPALDPLEGQSSQVTSIAFSPDGSTLASGSLDGTIILWDLAGRGQPARTLEGRPGQVTSIAFSPDGSSLASGSLDGTITLWDLAGRSQLAETYEGAHEVTSVVFRPDGQTVVAGIDDGSITLLDIATRTRIGEPFEGPGSVSSIAFSPDGSRMAVGSGDGMVTLWETASGTQIGEPFEGPGSVSSIAFSPDGSRMAVGSGDGMVTLWETASGTQIGEPFEGPGSVSSIAFSPDGSRMAVGSGDGMVTLWETGDPDSRHDAPNRHAGKVTAIAFSPDGTWLASGGQDKTIWFWNMQEDTHAQTFQLKGDVGSLTSIAFSPDGTTLASGSGESSPGRQDASITLWDVAGHSMLAAPLERGIGHVTSVAFSPDGDRLASGDAAGDITVWDVDPSSWAEHLCDRANRDLTADEWAVYLPGEHASTTCP